MEIIVKYHSPNDNNFHIVSQQLAKMVGEVLGDEKKARNTVKT